MGFATEVGDFFAELARLAGEAVLPYFHTALEVDNKAREGFDPVTAADRAAEQSLRSAISQRYPSHSILGEEFGEQLGTSSLRWIIDPIDGTRSFMSGIPIWGTLIGLWDGTMPLYGMMSQPYIGERYIGGNRETHWRRGAESRILTTRATTSLRAATLFATAPEMFGPDSEAPAFKRLSEQVRMTRYGADCYAYCALAAGQLDLVVEAGLGFYDIAALIPIVEGAGGVVTDWQGRAVTGGGRIIAAANPVIHALALAALGDP
ncbi:MAG: histidinol-phosphatase [Gammaproteobacteria bacterium]|nr:histidinol-phosphatase [Gammaproteobacteria bacterium]